MRDFNALTGTDEESYETCVVPHESETVNQNSTKVLEFARNSGLWVAGSWLKCPQAHHWTRYSNIGGVAKEIDHVLIEHCSRMIQNCRVFRSAQFLDTDHMLVVATLKLQLKSEKMDVGKLIERPA